MTEYIRRVYALSPEMLALIENFQKAQGYKSEVNAVRHLLGEALKGHDDNDKVIAIFQHKLSQTGDLREAASEFIHPLVSEITFEDEAVTVRFKCGRIFTAKGAK